MGKTVAKMEIVKGKFVRYTMERVLCLKVFLEDAMLSVRVQVVRIVLVLQTPVARVAVTRAKFAT